MKKYSMFLLFAAATLLWSCGSREKDIEKITTLEKEVFSPKTGYNDAKAQELLGLYEAFADHHAKDSLAPEYLFKAAGISKSLNKGEDAVRLYDRVINEYPDYKGVAMAYFLKAFVYEDNMRNINKARECYNEFLKRYPDHEYADDAQASINNLGKTDEQLIKEFEEANKKIQDSLANLASGK